MSWNQALVACFVDASFATGVTYPALVRRVIDGDKFDVWFGGDLAQVRVVGGDTPEIGKRGLQKAPLAAKDASRRRLVEELSL